MLGVILNCCSCLLKCLFQKDFADIDVSSIPKALLVCHCFWVVLSNTPEECQGFPKDNSFAALKTISNTKTLFQEGTPWNTQRLKSWFVGMVLNNVKNLPEGNSVNPPIHPLLCYSCCILLSTTSKKCQVSTRKEERKESMKQKGNNRRTQITQERMEQRKARSNIDKVHLFSKIPSLTGEPKTGESIEHRLKWYKSWLRFMTFFPRPCSPESSVGWIPTGEVHANVSIQHRWFPSVSPYLMARQLGAIADFQTNHDIVWLGWLVLFQFYNIHDLPIGSYYVTIFPT